MRRVDKNVFNGTVQNSVQYFGVDPLFMQQTNSYSMSKRLKKWNGLAFGWFKSRLDGIRIWWWHVFLLIKRSSNVTFCVFWSFFQNASCKPCFRLRFRFQEIWWQTWNKEGSGLRTCLFRKVKWRDVCCLSPPSPPPAPRHPPRNSPYPPPPTHLIITIVIINIIIIIIIIIVTARASSQLEGFITGILPSLQTLSCSKLILQGKRSRKQSWLSGLRGLSWPSVVSSLA